jgi:hypothetical protein
VRHGKTIWTATGATKPDSRLISSRGRRGTYGRRRGQKGLGEGLRVGVALGEGLRVGVALGEGLGVGVALGEGLGVGVALGEGLGVGVAQAPVLTVVVVVVIAVVSVVVDDSTVVVVVVVDPLVSSVVVVVEVGGFDLVLILGVETTVVVLVPEAPALAAFGPVTVWVVVDLVVVGRPTNILGTITVVVVIPDGLAVVVVVVVDVRVVVTEVLVTDLVIVASVGFAHAGGRVGGATAGSAISASASCCSALLTEGSNSLSGYDPATESASWTMVSCLMNSIVALSAPIIRSELTIPSGNPFWLIVFSASLTWSGVMVVVGKPPLCKESTKEARRARLALTAIPRECRYPIPTARWILTQLVSPAALAPAARLNVTTAAMAYPICRARLCIRAWKLSISSCVRPGSKATAGTGGNFTAAIIL